LLSSGEKGVTIWVDENGDDIPEKTFEVVNDFSDTFAPTTTPTITGSLATSTAYTDAVTVALDAVDNSGGVGVASTTYSIDKGPWQKYATTSPIVITTEGDHAIQYYSTDWFGNTETTKTLSFKIVSARGLIEDVQAALAGDASADAHKASQMLTNALDPKYWQSRYTLNHSGAQSVDSHLKNAIKFLNGATYAGLRAQLELAQRILFGS
jgi:hypothetical protein